MNHLDFGHDPPHRFLTLYAADNIESHPDGLIFDQVMNTAILQMSIFDHQTTHNGRQRWYPLERVLQAWLDMIDIGKVQAVPVEVGVPNEKYEPWINKPYSEQMLQETIGIFDDLVDAIKARFPNIITQPRITGLVDEDILQASKLPQGFVYDFITNVKRPTFKYIAPGLQLPTASSFPNQPFLTVPTNYLPDPIIPAILLFRPTQNYTVPPNSPNTGSGLPFGYPYNHVPQYPAGLYLSPADREDSNVLEDECKLVLPFGIGANGYARTGDGARFGENTEAEDGGSKDTFADLYHPGYSPFADFHGVRLVEVLRSWLGMVERADWVVDGEGVVGGMEAWREADTEGRWGNFVVPTSW